MSERTRTQAQDDTYGHPSERNIREIMVFEAAANLSHKTAEYHQQRVSMEVTYV